MRNFEITIQGENTGDISNTIVEGEELVETLMREKRFYSHSNFIVVGIREITTGFLVQVGSEVFKGSKRGIVTSQNQRTGQVGVMWVGANYELREDPMDLEAIS